MKKFLFSVAMLLLCSCSKMPGVLAPPDRWTHGPLPADLKIIEVPASEVQEDCLKAGDDVPSPDFMIMACWIGATHTIYLPTPASDPVVFNALKEHELAHARGWIHNADETKSLN